ncbi:MAG: hypothetical protein RIS63_1047 [Bacteroidota bacterium]|jgi:hypothetical protein
MRYLNYFLLLSVSWACQKAPQRSCWKTAGPTQNLMVPLSSFTYLHIHPHIQVALVQDSMDFIEWQAGAHLLPFLSAEIQADTLQLQNNNGCRFLRYRNGQVKAVVHFSSLNELHLSNSETVQTQQQWFANDLLIFLKEGVGAVDLNISAHKVTVRNNYGWQTLQLTGTVGSLFVDLDGSSSLQAASLLATDSISFRSISPRACYITADQLFVKAQLYGAGNLYYHGQPSQILKTEYGTGRVLAH